MSKRRTLTDPDIQDGFLYSIELKFQDLSRTELDKLLHFITELPSKVVEYKGQFTKAPITPEQKTSI